MGGRIKSGHDRGWGSAGRQHPRGFALLIVLWSVVLLAILATGITLAGRSDTQLAGNIRRAAAAEAAADAGVAAAVFHMADAPARAWVADGRPRALPFGRYAITLRIRDENRLLNPNFAPPALMAALLAAAGADTQRAAAIALAIVEWHAPGMREQVTARYRAAGQPAAPTGQAFASVGEVGLVMGMTPALLAALRPHLSVFAPGPLNYAQADPVVRDALRSLGGGEPPAAEPRASVLDITADAQGADGSRFVRHAVVALGQDEAKRLYETLLWEALPARQN